MVALDDRRARRLTALDNVRVNRALREVIQLAELFGFRLEYFQEVTTDNLALRFGVGNALQVLIEDFAGVGRNQTHGESVREHIHHLLGFALAHEAVVNVDAGQAVADGLINQRRRDGGVHAAGKSQQHRALVAHDFADVGNRRLRVGFHRPVAHAAADIQEVFDNRAPLVGVGHFRMELHAVDAPVVVRHRRNGAVRAVRNRVETSRALLHLIGMAQPAGGGIRHAGEQARLIVHRHGDSAIFALCRLFHRAAQQIRRQLHSVADAQHRHAQLIHALVAAGCILFQHARRAAGENHAHGVLRANRLQTRVIGQDAGIHMAFAHAPRNQLRVLSAEIQNDDFLCFRH